MFIWNNFATLKENFGLMLTFTSLTKNVPAFVLSFSLQAMHLSVNPLYYMIPATIGCSYAFMLPVSTPPNSIAFASGHLMVRDMVRQSYQHLMLKQVVTFYQTCCFLLLFSGENRYCHEHPGCSLSLSGHEHVGRCHVWLEHISRMGPPPQQICSFCRCAPFCPVGQCYALITHSISTWT